VVHVLSPGTDTSTARSTPHPEAQCTKLSRILPSSPSHRQVGRHAMSIRRGYLCRLTAASSARIGVAHAGILMQGPTGMKSERSQYQVTLYLTHGGSRLRAMRQRGWSEYRAVPAPSCRAHRWQRRACKVEGCGRSLWHPLTSGRPLMLGATILKRCGPGMRVRRLSKAAIGYMCGT
jgi:hypothetical protein